jgi:hypothetical protein
VAALDVGIDDLRSDKSRATGNHDFHTPGSVTLLRK